MSGEQDVAGEVPGRTARPRPGNMSELCCQPCQFGGTSVAAEGYCQTCKEHLCQACVNHHPRQRMFRNHVLLGKDDMPQEVVADEIHNDICTEPCKQHPGRVIEIICHTHDKAPLCSECFIKGEHRNCSFKYLPDVAKSFKLGREYNNMTWSIEQLCHTSSYLGGLVQNIEQGRVSSHKTALAEIKAIRARIIAHLNRAERALLTKAKQHNVRQTKLFANAQLQQDIQRVDKEIQDLKSDIHGQTIQKLVTTTSQSHAEISRLQSECQAIYEKLGGFLLAYNFQPSSILQQMMYSNTPLGELNVKQAEFSSRYAVRDISDMKITETGTISVAHSSTDTRVPWITSMVVSSSGQLLLVDHNNQCIKLVDTATQNIARTLSLSDFPWDITCIPDDQVAVTLPNKHMVEIVPTRAAASAPSKPVLKVSGDCHGITYHDQQLFVSFWEPEWIEVLNLEGVVLKQIAADMFTSPSYLCVQHSDVDTFIYVSDHGNKSVSKITLDGRLLQQYSSKTLLPLGLVTIGDRHALVCSKKPSVIHMLGEESRAGAQGEVCVLATEGDDKGLKLVKEWEIAESPRAIAFSIEKGLLYVSTGTKGFVNSVHMYKMCV